MNMKDFRISKTSFKLRSKLFMSKKSICFHFRNATSLKREDGAMQPCTASAPSPGDVIGKPYISRPQAQQPRLPVPHLTQATERGAAG